MTDFRPLIPILGLLLVVLAAMMLVPAATEALHRTPDTLAFLASAALTGFVGAALWLAGREQRVTALSIRQAFLLTSLVWITTSAFAAVPFMWGKTQLGFAAAYFEAMSGLTTTGGTAITGLDTMPAGILLWRSILHFYGGVGILVLAIAVLPLLQIGGMQLFRTESSEQAEKLFPRAGQIAAATIGTITALTLACAVAYIAAGMPAFDAINLAMSTLSTGGMAVSDSSLGIYKSAAIDWIAVVFMIAGALPLLIVLKMTLNLDPLAVIRSPEVQLFGAVIVIFSGLLWIHVEFAGLHHGHDALRFTVFSVVSLITTTGLATVDYAGWGAFSDVLLFTVTFLGGCTGSTAGGLKMFRLIVIWQAIAQQLRRSLRPNGVFPMTYDGRRLTDEIVVSVMSFAALYVLTFLIVAALLNASGLDFTTSVSAAIANLSNTGPGLGARVGPAGTYADMTAFQYALLTFAMLVGRLEIVTVFVLLLPRFWRH